MSPDWIGQMELYMSLERCEMFRDQVETIRLQSQLDDGELKRIFSLPRLTFGTAGIRGQMGPGFGQMNDLVIIQTSQGLVSYLLEKYGNELCHKRGVIIGHDARHNSARFARLVALAFLQKSIPVYFVNHIIPTPLIAHGVTYFNCHCGIVITASHNPKQDNGYKVYWANGAQIQSPHDRNIQGHIMRQENLQPWHDDYSWNHEYLSPPPTNATTDTTTQKQTTRKQQLLVLPEQMSGILYQVYDELCKSYYAYLQGSLVMAELQKLTKTPLRITYTTMHGVGHEFLTRALKLAGFNSCHPVQAQAEPNPDFPTVEFPNPEEAGALELAFQTAAHTSSTLILANDPDADRCAAALYCPATKRRRPLSGNEIGSLLGWWAWHRYQQQQQLKSNSNTKLLPASSSPEDDKQQQQQQRSKQLIKSTQTTATLGYYDVFEDEDDDQELATDKTPATPITKPMIGAGCVRLPPPHVPAQVKAVKTRTARTTTSPPQAKRRAEDCYMISTAVSSRFLNSMARVEKFNFVETLTGFKYMGNLAHDLLKRGKQVLFAYEEAIGYMVDAQILDKDGISAALQLAQCAAYLAHTHGRTLEAQLEWLYERYGYHFNLNSYYICHEPALIRKIFHHLQSNYPKSFKSSSNQDDEEFIVTRVRDLNNGIDNGTPDHKPDLPVSSGSYMVTFWTNDIRFTIRTSGTEPKIKFYSEIVDSKNDQANAQARLRRFVKAAVERCLQPEVNKLKPASGML